MSQLTEYITKEGDRWDTIAYAAYGDASEIQRLIEANPTVPIDPVLPAGVRLLVPIIETVSVEIDDKLLPPWK
jgi:phage tail protein X